MGSFADWDETEDIKKLKQAIPLLHGLSDRAVAAMYSYWSEETNCAGWLVLEYGLEEFKYFVEHEPGEKYGRKGEA